MSRDDPSLQPFRVQLVEFDAALAELRAVRDEVFVCEQGVPVELEHDALDPHCAHVLARLLDGTPVGTAFGFAASLQKTCWETSRARSGLRVTRPATL